MIVGLKSIWNARCCAPAAPNSEIAKALKRSHLALVTALLLAASAGSQENPKDLAEKSIEDLMNMEVTSVSKKEQKLSSVAAAIFVITQEDIRRSGATNIPDVLRMVPGLDVAQIDANAWAISARGFNSQFANKLLVLIDGRAVYTRSMAVFIGTRKTCRWRTLSGSKWCVGRAELYGGRTR
jgi:outer membrane receptor for ferrienterochelin and colicin